MGCVIVPMRSKEASQWESIPTSSSDERAAAQHRDARYSGVPDVSLKFSGCVGFTALGVNHSYRESSSFPSLPCYRRSPLASPVSVSSASSVSPGMMRKIILRSRLVVTSEGLRLERRNIVTSRHAGRISPSSSGRVSLPTVAIQAQLVIITP